MNLQLKRLIFKYTGIYLAHKEELEYVTSKKFWKQFFKMAQSNKKEKLSATNIQGILTGSWAAHNGFSRPMSFLTFKKPSWFWRPVAWIVDLLTVLKWDIIDMLKRRENRK